MTKRRRTKLIPSHRRGGSFFALSHKNTIMRSSKFRRR